MSALPIIGTSFKEEKQKPQLSPCRETETDADLTRRRRRLLRSAKSSECLRPKKLTEHKEVADTKEEKLKSLEEDLARHRLRSRRKSEDNFVGKEDQQEGEDFLGEVNNLRLR